jgi:ribokinase
MFAAYAPALVDYIHMIETFPERGGHAIVKSTIKMPGGAGANVAHNLAIVGINAELFTTLGRDEDAEFFIKNTCAKVRAEITDEKTGKVDVFVDREGERTFFVYPNAAAKPFIEVERRHYIYLDPFPSEFSFELQMKVAREYRDEVVILNPGFPYVSLGFERLKNLIELTKILFLSEAEYRLLGVDVRSLLNLTECVVITRGAKGSSCYTRMGEWHEEGIKARVIDTTGAGDAFAAGFIFGIINGYSPDVCLKLGNFCGAYNVERIGARNFPSSEEIDDFLARVLR